MNASKVARLPVNLLHKLELYINMNMFRRLFLYKSFNSNLNPVACGDAMRTMFIGIYRYP